MNAVADFLRKSAYVPPTCAECPLFRAVDPPNLHPSRANRAPCQRLPIPPEKNFPVASLRKFSYHSYHNGLLVS